MAIEKEVPKATWKFDSPLIYTGVGKVNAALVATRAIMEFQPDLVLNLGTAGTLDKDCQGVCEISSVIQRDFDTHPLAPRGVVPYQSTPSELNSGYGKYRCGTGDSFMTQKDSWSQANGIQLVDMELYSIAQASYIAKTPWRSAKYVSDIVGENSGNIWESQLFTANIELQNWYRENILEMLK